MTIFEKLKREMFEEIRAKICDFLINDCDLCPAFISKRCQEPCNTEDLEVILGKGDEANVEF